MATADSMLPKMREWNTCICHIAFKFNAANTLHFIINEYDIKQDKIMPIKQMLTVVLFLSMSDIMKRMFLITILRLVLLLTLGLSNCKSSGTNPSSRQDDTTYAPTAAINTTRGHELFQQRCIACHGLNGKYRNNNAADLQFNKLDSIGIINTIVNGKGAMPMFDHVMPDSDLAQLELYVKTLRR